MKSKLTKKRCILFKMSKESSLYAQMIFKKRSKKQKMLLLVSNIASNTPMPKAPPLINLEKLDAWWNKTNLKQKSKFLLIIELWNLKLSYLNQVP